MPPETPNIRTFLGIKEAKEATEASPIKTPSSAKETSVQQEKMKMERQQEEQQERESAEKKMDDALAREGKEVTTLSEVQGQLTDIEKLWDEIKDLNPEKRNALPNEQKLNEQLDILRDKLGKLSDAEVATFLTEQKGFQRLSDLYFSTYHAELSKDTRLPKLMAEAIQTITAKEPELAALHATEGSFFKQTSDMINATLGQRAIFFAMAKNGAVGKEGYEKGKPYMNYAWYAKMSEDLKKGSVEVPSQILQNQRSIEDKTHMHIYHQGGFELARSIAEMASVANNPIAMEKLEKSRVLERMFLYATHPSPVNGHVSLSAQMLESLSKIAEKNPRAFDYFVDIKDPVLGQTPREFFVANSVEKEDMPFMKLTDRKRSNEYQSSCKRLVSALGINPNK